MPTRPVQAHGFHDHGIQDSLTIEPADSLSGARRIHPPFEVTIRAKGLRLDLGLLGRGTRTHGKLFTYAAHLYVDTSADLKGEPHQKIVGGGFARMMHLRFLRDFDGDALREEFSAALTDTTVSEEEKEEFLSFFDGGVTKGQTLDLVWVPGLGLHTRVAGHWHSAISDKGLADSVFGMWLGEKPVSDFMKSELIGLLKKRK
jgi:hypothetical protein